MPFPITIKACIKAYEHSKLTPYLITAIACTRRASMVNGYDVDDLIDRWKQQLPKKYPSPVRVSIIPFGIPFYYKENTLPFYAYLKPKRFTHDARHRVTQINFQASSVEDACEYAAKWFGVEKVI